jgi:DNA-binding beta-propeller fold protein YncE
VNRRRFLGLAAATALFGPAAVRAAPALLAAATCDEEARLAVVDVRAGRVVRFIPCLPDPRSIESLGWHTAVVCHTAAGAVSILDGSSLGIRAVVRGFTEPRYVAAHPGGRSAFVTDSGTKEVVAVDVAAGHRRGRLKLEEWPRHITADPQRQRLWVGLGTASEHVAVVDVSDPGRLRLERMVHPPFLAHDVGFEPDGRRVWVTSGNLDELAVYTPEGRLLQRLPADAPPQHVTFGGGMAYVTSGDDGTLRAVSLRHGRAVASVRVPVGSYNVQSGHGLVLTPSLVSGALSVLNRASRLVHHVEVASSSHDACFLS